MGALIRSDPGPRGRGDRWEDDPRIVDRGREQGALHVVSAGACDRRLVPGQRQVGDKPGEIAAIPELLDVLDIKGAIVITLDAMGGGQRAIASRILEEGRWVIS